VRFVAKERKRIEREDWDRGLFPGSIRERKDEMQSGGKDETTVPLSG